ncbi:ABC transporter ATP-binding protein [Streptomyces inusitatus]|uniref:ABC transporter ATP-binding protein n=1 Tax=Streptomyces inusitatus TaxID=68221 RepID=UPI001E2F0936|nr:ABC transporter ATP-binding protein [Streptomyces inusitatus]
MLTVRELCKTYRADSGSPLHACDRVDMEAARGEIVALTGPSGSGKSTLLHLIGALDVPDSGTVEVDGREITGLGRRALAEYRRGVGFVFQRFHLLPTLTALDNVTAPVLPYRTDFDKRARARELLESVGLGERTGALPSKLSGGQQQRVAIARALIGRPALLLADEPTGNLDSGTGKEIVEVLLGLRERFGTTVVMATHDPGVVARCDRAVELRDGRVG